MAHFALVTNGIVETVIVAEQDYIDSLEVEDGSQWIQTSYNTRGGVYYLPNSHTPGPDQSKALRKNYAGIGGLYDAERDAFTFPSPCASWVFNEQSCLWEPPIQMPDDGNFYLWDEETVSWADQGVKLAPASA
jgi:hypothetical protein